MVVLLTSYISCKRPSPPTPDRERTPTSRLRLNRNHHFRLATGQALGATSCVRPSWAETKRGSSPLFIEFQGKFQEGNLSSHVVKQPVAVKDGLPIEHSGDGGAGDFAVTNCLLELYGPLELYELAELTLIFRCETEAAAKYTGLNDR